MLGSYKKKLHFPQVIYDSHSLPCNLEVEVT